MELIPSIDLRGGRVVRLEQGDYDRETRYDFDPVEVARGFEVAGARRVHVVDLDGARDGRAGNDAEIRKILAACPRLSVQVGGGMRTRERVKEVLSAGAARVVIGTAALEQPELLMELATLFPDRIILGLDAREGRVAVRGWREIRAETVEQVLERFAKLPLAAVLHTDIGRDGLLGGPNVEATAALARRSPFPVLASGGVGSIEDLERLARARVISGAIVGKAIYSGAIRVEDAIARLRAC
ncbi:MAG: 1-(5-phosphoribosyl)-5-[(5-phosphoribosylamino)methylideneamino]imidazole-4-carboxamide isomerase [Deltaproteobacteria bacterium]|nr:1-(5-phosphoribosyl)-5-[(5-phosphoribosylamino)methylideneamino]imidazole-4-carboxamide isomerase [Deltaproteobacteria bacterium]